MLAQVQRLTRHPGRVAPRHRNEHPAGGRELTRSGSYQMSGTDIVTTTLVATDRANTNFSGAFVAADGTGGNYLKFTITAGGFTLTATPSTAAGMYLRAPVNAIQIVPR